MEIAKRVPTCLGSTKKCGVQAANATSTRAGFEGCMNQKLRRLTRPHKSAPHTCWSSAFRTTAASAILLPLVRRAAPMVNNGMSRNEVGRHQGNQRRTGADRRADRTRRRWRGRHRDARAARGQAPSPGQYDRDALARAGLAERRHRAITGVPRGSRNSNARRPACSEAIWSSWRDVRQWGRPRLQ